MRLEQLATRLQTAGLGTLGSTLFANYMPPTITRGAVLLPSLSGDPINWELGNAWRNNTSFQLIVRETVENFESGYIWTKQLIEALTVNTNTILAALGSAPQLNVIHIRPKHDIITYPRSPGGLMEFSVNFDTAFVIS